MAWSQLQQSRSQRSPCISYTGAPLTSTRVSARQQQQQHELSETLPITSPFSGVTTRRLGFAQQWGRWVYILSTSLLSPGAPSSMWNTGPSPSQHKQQCKHSFSSAIQYTLPSGLECTVKPSCPCRSPFSRVTALPRFKEMSDFMSRFPFSRALRARARPAGKRCSVARAPDSAPSPGRSLSSDEDASPAPQAAPAAAPIAVPMHCPSDSSLVLSLK
mmetsp:Transcript_115036/g.303769  ORF Transcript_115036/g.303769 Transcript_115036/m.303769 type:complete len:217 (-) Transcript_115036:142-792(-)